MRKEGQTPEATEFDGQRVLVTGGTKGIGEAIVKRLSRAGARVITTACFKRRIYVSST
jgi:NAD(P)-dependent dehydrogenase (short-subunit alcohol dehydrogenase family)